MIQKRIWYKTINKDIKRQYQYTGYYLLGIPLFIIKEEL